MCHKNVCIIGISIAFLLLSLLNINMVAAAVTVDDILSGIRQSDSFLKSGRGTLVVRSRTTEHGKQHFAQPLASMSKSEKLKELLVVSSDNNVSYWFDGEKTRCNVETSNELWDGESKKEDKYQIDWAYDGETVRELKVSPDGISATLDSSLDRFDTRLDPRYWGLSAWGKPMAETMERLTPELMGTETLEGDLCYIIKLNPPIPSGVPSEKIETYKFWIAPQKGYRARKVETSTANEILITTNRFRELSPGIWFPYSAVKRWFLIEPNTLDRIVATEVTMEVGQFEVDVEIPDSVFQLTFEAGTEVYDVRTNTRYTAE